MNPQPLVLDVPDGGRLLSRAFQDSGFCVVGGPEIIFGQDMKGWRPPTFSVKSQKYFTKEGAIRLLGNGVPYDMGLHVARAVCLALGMPDPGSVVRQPDQTLFQEVAK